MFDEEEITEEEVEEFLDKYRTVKEQVEYVLANYPSSRNCDELLWWLVLKIFHKDVYDAFRKAAHKGYIPMDVLKKVPKFESITRARRQFNERGLYLPTDPEVLERRRRGEKVWRKAMARWSD